MAVPDYQSMMLPLLQALADGREQAIADVRDALAARLGLTDTDRNELLPSGKQAVFDNRVGWAKTYLEKAGLLGTGRRGVCQITAARQDVLTPKRPPKSSHSH